MNIELDDVVVQDVSDDELELAAGGAQGERRGTSGQQCFSSSGLHECSFLSLNVAS